MAPNPLQSTTQKEGRYDCFRSLIQVWDERENIPYHTDMRRFFFNLHECGRITTDYDGVVMADVQAARANAVHEARQIMAAEVSDGRLCLACHIEVIDEARNPVLVVSFADAIVLSGYQPKALQN